MPIRVAFVTLFCPHYRVRTFELLAREFELDYYFVSRGDERYWQPQHGVRSGAFRHRYLASFRVGGVRVAPSLPLRLFWGRYEVYVAGISGPFALLMTFLVARLRRKPFVLWTGIWARLRTPLHRVAFPLTQYVYRHASAIAVYGQHVKDYLKSEGVAPDRVFVAPHAVDNETYRRRPNSVQLEALRAQLMLPKDQRVVLFLGRLEPEKGLTTLLDAFASLQLRDAVLVLAGAGSQREALLERAQRLGILDRTRMPGYVEVDRARLYYALAAVCVLPSVTVPDFKEPWGLVVNEAFNAGVPVITSDAVGAAAGGLVQSGVNGFVFREGDVAALASHMARLLDDPALRTRLGEGALASVDRWSNREMVSGFVDAIAFARTASRRRRADDPALHRGEV